jgi:charged multivesicular body protein 7
VTHKDHGAPVCLPDVFRNGLKQGILVPVRDWEYSSISIYKKTWLPSLSDIFKWGLNKIMPDNPNKVPVGLFVILHNVEAAGERIMKQFRELPDTSYADRIMSRRSFEKMFVHILGSETFLTSEDFKIVLKHLDRDKDAISYNDKTVKFKANNEQKVPVTEVDEAISTLQDSRNKLLGQLPRLHAEISLLHDEARTAAKAGNMARARVTLRKKKLFEGTLDNRSKLLGQLDDAYMKLQQAADQVGIVEAMRVGAEAMDTLNTQVGGTEGVQNVMDAVNEQMTTVDEISNAINQNASAIDEGDIDEEFEALQNAEKEKKEQEAAGLLEELPRVPTPLSRVSRRSSVQARDKDEPMPLPG